MDSYRKCMVAFLDILGFKNMIHTKAFDEIKNIFLSIIPQEHLTLEDGASDEPWMYAERILVGDFEMQNEMGAS